MKNQESVLQTVTRLLAFFLLLAAPAMAMAMRKSGDIDSNGRPRRVTQRGRIEMNGCFVGRHDLTLTASPVQFSATGPGSTASAKDDDDDDDREAEDDSGDRDRPHLRRAQIFATPDPQIFRFVIHGLRATTIYSLDVRLRTGLCGKVTWLGPKRGLIVPGQKTRVALRAFRLTTQIDVETTDASGNVKFLAADALSFASATRVFRWHSDLPGVSNAELQIAVDRFSSSTDTPESCANPSGLLARFPVQGKEGDNLTPPIDFNRVIFGNPGPRNASATVGAPPQPTQFAVANGAPIYVRVVPLAATGIPRCDLPHDGVAALAILDYINHAVVPGVASPSLTISGDYRPARPVLPFDQCLMAVTNHPVDTKVVQELMNGDFFAAFGADPFAVQFFPNAMLINGSFQGIILAGATTCWNKSHSFLDDVGNFLSGIVEGIAELVDFVADLYNGIKNKIVEAVAFVISQIPGITCDRGSICQDELNAALATALTALGLPPSLPNFHDLANQGLDYIEGEIADETGLPKEVVDKIARGVIDAVSQAQGGGGGLPSWVASTNGFLPSVLFLNVERPADTLSASPNFLSIHTSPDGLYPDRTLPLPSSLNPAGASLTIAVQLPPDLSGIDANLPPPFDQFPELVLRSKLINWFNHRFTGKCSTIGFQARHGSLDDPSAPVEDLGSQTINDDNATHIFSNGTLCPF